LAGEDRKIGGTMPMLAPPLDPDKPKFLEKVRNMNWTTRFLLKNRAWYPTILTFVTF